MRCNIGACLLGVMLGMAGCATPPVDDLAATPWAQGQPWRQASSSVLLTPQARQAMADAGQHPDDPRWYDSRRDERPGVVHDIGRHRVAWQVSGSYSHSHYGSSRGRVYDSSATHTYQRRIEITPR